VEEYTDAVSDTLAETADGGRSYTRALLGVAGLAAGGYLAAKLRHWL
jgi:hypothetical protein